MQKAFKVAPVYGTRQSAQLHSLRASRLSPPTPPHYAHACVLRWDVWIVRSSQTSTYCACAGSRGAEADLRHVTVSERPTTDIRETCTKKDGLGGEGQADTPNAKPFPD